MPRRESPSNTGNEHGRRVKRRASRGASSSRAQQSQQREPVVDLPYGYLFDNNVEEHEKFVANFATRPICKPKSLDIAFFAREGFEIVPTLDLAHLRGLAEMTCPYSEVMVRAFYHNMNFVDGHLESRVCGTDIVVDSDCWRSLLGYNFDALETHMYDGDSATVPFPGYNREDAVREARRLGPWRPVVSVGQMTIDARILFYVMTHILFPRPFNHSRMLEGDIPVMWAIRHAINVNWRYYICWMMMKAKQKPNAALPYAYLVQRILEYFRVPMDNEQMVIQRAWNSRFGQRLVEQCKIMKGENGVWHYTNVPEEDADVGEAPPIVPPEVQDEDDEDVHTEETVEPEGGFSIGDVMRAINAMEMKQKKRWRKENERWKWIQASMQGIEHRLGQLQLGREQEAADDEEGEEEAGTSEEEA